MIFFHYLKKYFLDQSIQKDSLFQFENRSTGFGVVASDTAGSHKMTGQQQPEALTHGTFVFMIK